LRKPGLTPYEEFANQDKCPECRTKLVDAGGELACPSCGLVLGINPISGISQASGTTLEALGSYVGRVPGKGEHGPKAGYIFGVSKLRVNPIGRDLSSIRCSRLIETVSCRFFLPRGVVQNAIQTAGRLLPNRRMYRVDMPGISAYSLLYACRSAGISHVGFSDLQKAYSETGHSVSRSQLLRIGRESSLPLPAIRAEALVQRAVAKLQSDATVLDRIMKAKLDDGRYFASLLEAARETAEDAVSLGGYSPKTVAAGSVWLAALNLGPKVIGQREAAEALGIAEYTVREFCSKFRKQQEAK
jgi:transcription initiation factor TFIIIB Brf1 subunit/transcription initiation factor TFIIB